MQTVDAHALEPTPPERDGAGRGGPLAGTRIVEFAGIGPVPMAGMLLGDLGADVIIIDRLSPSGLGIPRARRFDVTRRGRRSLALDLKTADGVACALDLIGRAVVGTAAAGAAEKIT